MNPNDIIAHYAVERLQLLVQLEQANARIKELEEAKKKGADQ